jgi:7,8-dihydropterin-6-yl-methyl-4-(beta-D-ribofuranosyl)aminobenzene 5'-phosphate synthase
MISVNGKCCSKPDEVFPLKEVDSVEIVSLVDNCVDFLSTIERKEVYQVRKWVKERKGDGWMREHFRLPVAEHGFSVLVRTFRSDGFHSILFDAGGSYDGVVANADRMGLDLSEIESIVLSHGHYDHFGGLLAVLRVVGKTGLPIVVHEDMFKTRGIAEPDGTVRKHLDFPTDDQVKPARYVRTKQPQLLAGDTILVTGEIPRKTDFEKGFSQHRVFVDGKWEPDPHVWDDRAIAINIKQKGLVVISGCAHSGIVNTTLYAKQIVAANDVFAIMGGFHLAGKEFEPRIVPTVKQLKLLNPQLIVPSHCTGWRGTYAIAQAMPDAFIWGSVGNLYRF